MAATDTTEAAAEEPAGDTFGDLAYPCGPGDGANADDGSEPGVTADSVTIGYGDDAGYATSPGLNHEMSDAVLALVKKCNELGGINGREIKTNYYDAAIVNVATAIQGACDGNNFFLVGEGWSLDSGQEEIRNSCGLPAVPTYTVSAAFAMANNVYQGVPNPADETPAGVFAQIAEIFPEEIKAVATLGGNYSATQETIEKVRAVSPDYGWNFVGDRIEYDIFGGVTDWTPFVKQVQETGATMLVWSGSCLPNLQKFAQTAKQNGLDIPIVTDANHYLPPTAPPPTPTARWTTSTCGSRSCRSKRPMPTRPRRTTSTWSRATAVTSPCSACRLRRRSSSGPRPRPSAAPPSPVTACWRRCPASRSGRLVACTPRPTPARTTRPPATPC